MATITVDNPTDDLMNWVREHGHVPEDMRKRIDLNDDGTVTLYRMLRGIHGGPMVVNDEVATEPVVVTPTRPIPLHVDGL
jgi:hypothetical protein